MFHTFITKSITTKDGPFIPFCKKKMRLASIVDELQGFSNSQYHETSPYFNIGLNGENVPLKAEYGMCHVQEEDRDESNPVDRSKHRCDEHHS